MSCWITYSQPSANRIAEVFSAANIVTVCEPVTEIQRLAVDGSLLQQHGDLPRFMIFLSQHAASAFLADASDEALVWLRGANTTQVLAIGPATAQVLRTAGVAAIRPEETSSEGLLAWLAAAELDPSDMVWLLTGQGGRDTVFTQLQHRCRLVRQDLYKRRERNVDALDLNKVTVAAVGSEHGLQLAARRMAGCDDLGLIVPSQRIADIAQQMGFLRIEVATASEGPSMLRAYALLHRPNRD